MPRLAIVGSGLIGGSFLRALARRPEYELLALDRRPETSAVIRAECPQVRTLTLPPPLTRGDLEKPKKQDRLELPHIPADRDNRRTDEAEAIRKDYPEFSQAVAACDIIIFCTPVDLIPRQAALISHLSPALLSDVGSTKQGLCAELEGLRFIGGHPMAGSERQGFECSRTDMFQNAPYVLCEGSREIYPEDREADLALLKDLARDLGAVPYVLTPEAHDRIVASVSHLPHVAAAALVNAVASCGDLALDLSAGGFRDITRIASSDPGLWAEICLSSAPALVPALDAFVDNVENFRSAVDNFDYDRLYSLFQQARQTRDSLPAAGSGALLADSALTVYVEDTPGSLAAITALLAEAGVSIRNLTLRNARQYEGGQLRIFVTDAVEQQKSLDILRSEGYDCE